MHAVEEKKIKSKGKEKTSKTTNKATKKIEFDYSDDSESYYMIEDCYMIGDNADVLTKVNKFLLTQDKLEDKEQVQQETLACYLPIVLVNTIFLEQTTKVDLVDLGSTTTLIKALMLPKNVFKNQK